MKNNLDIYTDKLSLLVLLVGTFKLIYFKNIRIFFYTKSYNLFFFEKFFKKKFKFINLSKFEEARIFINKKTLFSSIWEEIDNFYDKIIDKNEFKYVSNYKVDKKKIDHSKFTGFFKESSIYLMYYGIKLFLVSKKFSKNNEVFFILKKGPFNSSLKKIYNINILSYIDINFYYKKKYELIYYEYYLKFYFFTRLKVFQLLYFSLKDFILGFCSKKSTNQESRVFLEVHQREINLENITDLFWLKFSSPLKKNVLAVLYKDYDQNSINNLKKNNINFKNHKNLHVSFFSFLKIIKFYFLIVFNLLSLNLAKWKKVSIYLYLIKTQYWYEIFKNENARIFFTMTDTDDNKFCKLNAIELNQGISVTCHWSNFPFCKINNRKHADILLTWGRHFEESIFNKCIYNKIYKIGYPSDHYFNYVGNKYKKVETDKFVITYMDNILYNDGFYSPSTNILIMKNFYKVLEKYENVSLYIKPKSSINFNRHSGKKEIIEKLIKNNRVKVLFNDSYNEKFCPAAAAAMSDLCIGLGVSTTSAESIFYGIPAFHLDKHYLVNDFTQTGKGKIVFNKVSDLFQAIENQINYEKISLKESKKISACLDPFQDRKSSLRASMIISYLFDLLEKKENIKDILLKLDIFISNNELFRDKLNYE